VIGLREGLEASLIVGIVAAFVRQSGRRDALRQVWYGVGLALVLCLAVGIALQAVDRELPQRQQEGLETVIGLIAVAMVTYMILWMRRNSRDLKRSLENATASALETGSTGALVAMAFLAVLREGFETAVFLIAAFNASTSPASAGTGALLGVLVAVVIGIGIYRGGVRINLSRFFRVTGLVLVLVAAGLLATAAHTAHEAGWLNAGQKQLFDMSWLVRPGTPLASVLTGVLGLQPRPVVAEFVVWIVYLVPLVLFIAWPAKRRGSPAASAAAQPAAAGTAAPEGAAPDATVPAATVPAATVPAAVGSGPVGPTAQTTTGELQPEPAPRN
jgi:high-affinity iron transporter